MSAAEFEIALAEGALAARTRLQIIDRRPLPPDFPTLPGFPEASYLKFAVAVRG
jgi:23S rRNA G2069 N7-methylase RlmK/C1962 C5-methylase RlmI